MPAAGGRGCRTSRHCRPARPMPYLSSQAASGYTPWSRPTSPTGCWSSKCTIGAATLTDRRHRSFTATARFIDLLRQPLHSAARPADPSTSPLQIAQRLLESAAPRRPARRGRGRGHPARRRRHHRARLPRRQYRARRCSRIVPLITDQTEQRHYRELQRTQEALRASEERLNLAQHAGSIGTFEWNIRTGAVNWSATMEQLYALPAGGFGGRYEDWKQAVHPDDWDRIEADQPAGSRRRRGIEHRIPQCPSRTDETRWIACKGKVFYRDGEPLRMLGACWISPSASGSRKNFARPTAGRTNFWPPWRMNCAIRWRPVRNALHILRTSRVEEQAVERMYEMMERQVTQLVHAGRRSHGDFAHHQRQDRTAQGGGCNWPPSCATRSRPASR